MFFFLLAGDDVKINDLELHFCKVFPCQCFCNKVLLERCLLERIKILFGHLQFMVGQKHNLVGHLTFPQIFSVGQNIRRVFHLVRQCLILIGYCAMSDLYSLWRVVLMACLFFLCVTPMKCSLRSPKTWWLNIPDC